MQKTELIAMQSSAIGDLSSNLLILMRDFWLWQFAVKYTAKLADGTVFEKEGFGEELYEFVTDEGMILMNLHV